MQRNDEARFRVEEIGIIAREQLFFISSIVISIVLSNCLIRVN